MSQKTKISILCIVCICTTNLIFSEEFRHRYNSNEEYTVKTTSEAKVYIDGDFQYKTGTNSDSVITVTAIGSGEAQYTEHINIAERIIKSDDSSALNEKKETAMYKKNQFGAYTIEEDVFFPVLRNIPIFPEKDVKIGESWKAQGFESHDFRQFGFESPFIIPTKVQYKYVRASTIDGKELHELNAKATFNSTNKMRPKNGDDNYPKKITGTIEYTIFWNQKTSCVDSYEEIFAVRMITSYNSVFDFIGTTKSNVKSKAVYIPPKEPEIPIVKIEPTPIPAKEESVPEPSSEPKKMNMTDTKEAEKKIKDLGLSNISVSSNSDGLKITLENIQFQSNSANLLGSEKEKIKKVAEILKLYTNDLLITGHTALAGTVDARLQLSRKRAQSVANYLIELGVRNKNNIVTKGFGAEQPIADNKTIEGMSKNRRVEITLLK